jgi:dTDP-4-amino-4,6-dideoxygalactose transaminase
MMPIARTVMDAEEARLVSEVLASGWITQGPRVRRLEEEFARYTGAPHACAVSNGTTALHLALLGVGVRPGDVVLTVSLSFIATANAIRHCQAEPVFVDIDPRTLNMSPAALAECVERDFAFHDGQLWYRHVGRLKTVESPLCRLADPIGRLGAILVVHQLGLPCDLGAILPLARERNIPVVEDAACAIGSKITLDKGQTWNKIGFPLGDVVCFSLHPRKVISTGEGGVLTFTDPKLDRPFRLLRQHGMSVSDAARHSAGQVVFEEYEITGFNYRMSDIQAAVGLAQLAKLQGILQQRRRLAERYAELLADVPGLRLPEAPLWARPNWQSYQVSVENPDWQRPLMQRLADKGISTRRGVMCAHREAPYRAAWPAGSLPAGSLPASEAAQDTGVILPLFPQMTQDEITQVAQALRQTMAGLVTQNRCIAA